MRLAALLALLTGLTAAHAAPLERDLGQGLAFVRIHALPADLPKSDFAPKRTALVVDLRYVSADTPAVAALEAWIKFHAAARTPVFLLANADTNPALLTPFVGRKPSGLVILGPAAPNFAPDIALKISAEDERHAYEALEQGAAIDSLLARNPDKPRNDEARLAKDHVPDGTPLPEQETSVAPKSAPPPPPTDFVLARAVHLHRTLVALKKL